MQQVIHGGEPVHDGALLSVAGKVCYFDYEFVPVLAHGGDVRLVAGSSRDVTAFRETNRALREANEDLQQFAYPASHDLQEPLRMVAIYCQLFQTKYTGRLDSQADEFITHCFEG